MQTNMDVEKGDSVGMEIVIKDLNFTVVSKKKDIKLLQSLTAKFPGAQLTALMGPSGSGKTTLLGRKSYGKVEGKLLYDQQQPSNNFLRNSVGYVEQFDTLIGNLTVTEMLRYTSEMKNPTTMPLAEKHAKVKAVIEQLNLDSCKDVKIGTPLARGVSGGQAKRINIGLALVSANTKILLLDEPTSGLDSHTATQVMRVVKELTSSSNITICATIHSPTPAIFQLFDNMMILLRGQMAYFGDAGLAMNFFQMNNPEAPSIGAGENVSDWIVDLTTQADMEGKAAAFAEAYHSSALRVANEETVNAESKLLDTQQNSSIGGSKRATTVGSIAGFFTILKYRSRRDFTDPQYLGPRIAERILLGFIIMSLYWHKGASNAASNINNVYSVLFLISILPGFTASAYIPVIVLERPLYYRELDDGLFRPITYLCAKLAGEFTIAAVGSLIFSWFVFFALELHGSYLLFLLVHYLTTAIGIVLAYFIASISPNLEVANAALPAYVVTLLFFVGLLIRPADTPDYWLWYSKLDFLRYGWRAHMINQFQGQNAIFVDNTEVLAYFSITNSKWYWFGLQSLFGVGFFVLALMGLTFVRYQKR